MKPEKKEKQTIDLRRVIIHPDALMIRLPEPSQILTVVQYAPNVDMPFLVLKTGARVCEFMPIEVGDEVFVEEIGAQKVLQLLLGSSDEVVKCIMIYSTSVQMVLKVDRGSGFDIDSFSLEMKKTVGDVPLPDSNVVSPALEQQRDAVS